MCNLAFFFLFLFNKFYVFFYYKFILIEKFIKQNKVNYSCCNVKYFDLYLSFNLFTASQYYVGVLFCDCIFFFII